jgi:hypothetical protein
MKEDYQPKFQEGDVITNIHTNNDLYILSVEWCVGFDKEGWAYHLKVNSTDGKVSSQHWCVVIDSQCICKRIERNKILKKLLG